MRSSLASAFERRPPDLARLGGGRGVVGEAPTSIATRVAPRSPCQRLERLGMLPGQLHGAVYGEPREGTPPTRCQANPKILSGKEIYRFRGCIAGERV